ncbi:MULTISPECIES: thiol-disulfide oxidoreductase DCC family protein [unclassified Rhizobium]|uniref:thiol-disulfide oxidoreductase DCC family protein n=1 Tax=unclassified Rhizobium TaxID=2613769 RepID=UPI00247A1FFC|nr:MULTISPECIES: DCC1-like thiol-disulfide oxidoreductase family protein [unclassified Rhizobium]
MESQPVPGTEQYSYRRDRAIPSFSDEGPIFVFDGECVFCSGWVKFALKHDKSGKYRFITAQSQIGSALFRHYGLDDRNFKTNLFLQDGWAYHRAEGTIRFVAGLGFPWTMCRVLRLIPRKWADGLYKFVARNRYRFAGRTTTCFVPKPEEKDLFIL